MLWCRGGIIIDTAKVNWYAGNYLYFKPRIKHMCPVVQAVG